MGRMEAHLCFEESLQSPVGGCKGDKKTKNIYPTLVWGPLMQKGSKSRLGRGGHRNSDPLTCIQLGLPPGWKGTNTLWWDFSQKKPSQCESIGPCLPSALQVRLSTVGERLERRWPPAMCRQPVWLGIPWSTGQVTCAHSILTCTTVPLLRVTFGLDIS